MSRRLFSATATALRRSATMAPEQSTNPGRFESALRKKITDAFHPLAFQVYNDSSKHSHHKAMVGNVSSETHFRLEVVSADFIGKRPLARHRMVYDLLRDELNADGGIHALQLFLKTPDEAQLQASRVSDTAAASDRAAEVGDDANADADGAAAKTDA